MDKGFRTWLDALGSAYPTALSPYWRALPLARMKRLLAGTFFTGAVGGFAVDLLQIGARPLGVGFFWPVFLGLLVSSLLATRIKKIRLVLPAMLLAGLMLWAASWAVRHATHNAIPEVLYRRISRDAVGVLVCGFVGSRLLVSFISVEGLASVRMQTELSLAHAMQATLVPTLAFETACFEVYGKSVPSTEMGGDLIDVIQSNGRMLVYIADISGHGLAAGQLMGMLKTALRVAIQSECEPAKLLESADRVLPALKDPSMYATLALLSFDSAPLAEYTVAGHLPILHYRARSRDTAWLSMEQFPLGLMPGGRYGSERVAYWQGDVFLMLTDGISEVANAKDEEFGLSAVEHLLAENAAEPLPSIWQVIMNKVHQHGAQQDDQTLLLIRAREQNES
jgi:hypothetical protein